MIPWFDASHIAIAGQMIPTQGPLAIAGIAVGHLTFGRWLQRHQGMTALRADQMGFAIIAAAVLVGHLTATYFTAPDAPFLQLYAPQSSLGALLGGGAMGLLLTGLWQLEPLVVIDGAAWAFMHGWPLVRLGCVLVHDHPGRRSILPIAVAFPEGPRLDIGLLEWLFCLLLLGFGRLLMRGAVAPGRLAAWATLLFSAARLVLEWLRVDSLDDLRQPTNFAAISVCGTGLLISALLWWLSRPLAADRV